MKINNFQGDLADISVKKEALLRNREYGSIAGHQTSHQCDSHVQVLVAKYSRKVFP